MTRWLATAAIALLFALNAYLPSSAVGRRGTVDRLVPRVLVHERVADTDR